MSQLDKVPNELVLKILKLAMMRDTPFRIDDCFRTAKGLRDSSIPELGTSSQLAESVQWFDMSRALRSVELRTSYFDEIDQRRKKLSDDDKLVSGWMLNKSSIKMQQPHLLDWRVAGSISVRLRKMGKEAFFSTKVLAMDINQIQKISERRLTRISIEDQQVALKYTDSLILIERHNQSPSTFIRLPRVIPRFSSLKSLDIYFGSREREPLAWMVMAMRDRIQPPVHLIDALTTIGVPMDQLSVGILICPAFEWRSLENLLKICVYPTLRAWGAIKAGKDSQGTASDIVSE